VSTLLHPNCPDDPCVDCTDCFIIESGCYVKWFCVASTVQVFGPNGGLRSTDQAGQIFRPSYGRWELWACNGIGCTPTLVASTEVENWQEADCPDTCCDNNDFYRVQISGASQYLVSTEILDRDYRAVIPGGQFVGLYLDELILSESLDFDFNGTYLFDIDAGTEAQPTCQPGDPTRMVLGTGTMISEGVARGTEYNGAVVCPFEVDTTTVATVELSLVPAQSVILIRILSSEVTASSSFNNYIANQCGSRFLSADLTPEPASTSRLMGQLAEPLTDLPCTQSRPIKWGIGTIFGTTIGTYGLFPGVYERPGGGTVAAALATFFQEGLFPAPPSTEYVSGTYTRDYI
jgi:hypothetical protein